MKNNIIKLSGLLVFLFSFNITFSQGIEFEQGYFSEALKKAKKEDKVLFMDCYTTWCGPCKWLSKEIFPKKEVGDFFNKNFVNIKIDMEKGEGIELAKKYNVKSFPTLLFISSEGKVVHKMVGGKDADALIEGARNALDPKKQLSYFINKYEKGERDISFVLEYIKLLEAANDHQRLEEVSNYLIKTLPIERFATKDMFKILVNAKVKFNSTAYKYVLSNKNTLLSKVDTFTYFQFFESTIYSHLNTIANNCANEEELKAAIEDCKKDYVLSAQPFFEEELYYSFLIAQGDLELWFNQKLKDLENTNDESSKFWIKLNIGNEVYKNIKLYSDTKTLDKAIKLGHDIIKSDSGLIMGNFLLAKLYLRKREKDKAFKHFNIFIEENGKAGGNNTHPTVTRVKDGIESL